MHILGKLGFAQGLNAHYALSVLGTHLEVCVGHVLKDEAGRFGARVLHHIHEVNDVWAATHILHAHPAHFQEDIRQAL